MRGKVTCSELGTAFGSEPQRLRVHVSIVSMAQPVLQHAASSRCVHRAAPWAAHSADASLQLDAKPLAHRRGAVPRLRPCAGWHTDKHLPEAVQHRTAAAWDA